MNGIPLATALAGISSRPLVRFLIYLGLLFALRWDCLDDPFFGDSLSYVMPTVFHQVDHGLEFYPIATHEEGPGIDGGGHPFLFFHILAILLKLGLPPLATTHVITMLFAALILFSVDRIAGVLAGNAAGFAAAGLVLVNPTFIAHAGLAMLEIPQTALTLLTLWAVLTGRWGWCTAFCSLSVLVKEPAVWVLPPLGLYALLVGERHGAIRRVVHVAIPGLVFAAWMVGCKLTTGLWINRPYTNWAYIGPMYRMTELFLNDGRAALTLAACGAVIWRTVRRRHLLHLFIMMGAAAAVMTGMPSLEGSIPSVRAALPWAAGGIAAMAGGIGTVWGSKGLLLWGALLMELVMLTILRETMPRYALVSFALFPVIAVHAVWHVRCAAVRWSAVALGVALAITAWNTPEANERNLRYREQLSGIRQAASWLERHHPDSKVLWVPPYSLLDPRYGYVSVPLDAYQLERLARQLPADTMPDLITCISIPSTMKHDGENCAARNRRLADKFNAHIVLDYVVDKPMVRVQLYRLVPDAPRDAEVPAESNPDP